MAPQRRQHLTFRLPEQTLGRLDARAHQIRETRTGLAERYLEEGLRMDEHPGIGFVDGPAGRRAVLVGTGLDVWGVIEVLLANRRSTAATARYLEVPEGRVREAVRYYGAFAAEIDEWLARARAAAEREEAVARRERAILG
ncbi:MAG: hypothetical protein ACRDFR_02085 [Candidatus Limnocylindria bacterium]